jgi:hypothetical protein
MSDFSGRWLTTFGPMTLTQSGAKVRGTYAYGGPPGVLEGKVVRNRFEFRYEDAGDRGEGQFDLLRPDRFLGRYRPEGQDGWRPWSGERGFDGIWESSFGLLRLVQEPDRVVGFYEAGGAATIEGQREGDRLVFRYREPRVGGEGEFELIDEGLAFTGRWRPDGAADWRPWQGRRRRAQPGLVWVVVIEAHWQSHLGEREYAYGFMLREFFARISGVEVRHRIFTNDDGLAKWCRELCYLAEPTAVLLATHGTTEGLSAHGRTVAPAAVVDSLRYADNIQLLHFSACLMMQEGPGGELVRALHRQAHYPVSGYTTAVDWGGSALVEFTYLDLVLAKGLPPEQAAEQLVRLVAFAGDKAPPGSAYPPLGFRILLPGQATAGQRAAKKRRA